SLDRRQDDTAAGGGVALLHERLQVGHGGFHGLGALQNLGDDQLVVVEKAADLVHSGHERAIYDVQGSSFFSLKLKIGDQSILASLDDIVRQALVEREV